MTLITTAASCRQAGCPGPALVVLAARALLWIYCTVYSNIHRHRHAHLPLPIEQLGEQYRHWIRATYKRWKGEEREGHGDRVLDWEMAEKDTTPFPPIDALMSSHYKKIVQRGTARSSKHFTASTLCHVLPAELVSLETPDDSCRKRDQIKGLPRTHAAGYLVHSKAQMERRKAQSHPRMEKHNGRCK